MTAERLGAAAMERYQAHLALPGFGPGGQARVRSAGVVIVGVGGLGCPAAQYLAAAGVGTLTLVDDDNVEASNLPRQNLFTDRDLERPKVEAAAARLGELNAASRVVAQNTRIVASNVTEIVAGADLVLDGSDNFATRYVVNDACVLGAIPLVSGSVYRQEGQVTVFETPGTGCYRCVFPAPPPAEPPCRDAGVLGPVAGVIGAAMATAALQRLAGGSTPLAGSMLLFDGGTMSSRTVALRRAPDCPLCGETPSIARPTASTPAGPNR
jgi:adenylyltransferase/sulfurtransferase